MSVYTEKITNYHASKPLFVQHVDLSTRPLIDINTSVKSLITAFDVDTAVGKQLDIIGEWVGRTRVVSQVISGVYFSLDTDSLGFDQGVWQGPYDPDTGFTSLSDETYRIILKAKIAINNWNGQNGTLPDILDNALSGSGVSMQVVDNQDMSISILILPEIEFANVSLELIEAIKQGYLTVKAAGVRVKEMVMPSDGSRLFAFDSDTQYLAGFDQGSWDEVVNGNE
ncbi:DUF2612 domain-containing protein [Tatumella sp. JGM130]|uniref:DUF2612 domain-containing protein n=1 Tax=Tatumella sp. JGM130 TaxID=2799797 RepID=UPI001BAF8E5F|nr:DUF2612 domain-containing protein [Tatumella sp. JGM130]MBS0893945.1 DUF2612 domain-containing protein [Tatumella sp. JGM130]